MKAEMNGLNERVVNKLIEKSLHISSAESCTGGLFSALITAVPGSSAFLDEAIVTYANSAKSARLGVKEETLENFGAVSKQTAYEMAEGIVKYANSDIGISITGIAGPGGGSDKKPVGTVFTAICCNGETSVYHLLINGNRDEVREETCRFVFEQLDKLLV